MNNPYEAPKAPLATPDFDDLMRGDLRVIGQMQKVIILCIAANFGLIAMASR